MEKRAVRVSSSGVVAIMSAITLSSSLCLPTHEIFDGWRASNDAVQRLNLACSLRRPDLLRMWGDRIAGRNSLSDIDHVANSYSRQSRFAASLALKCDQLAVVSQQP